MSDALICSYYDHDTGELIFLAPFCCLADGRGGPRPHREPPLIFESPWSFDILAFFFFFLDNLDL